MASLAGEKRKNDEKAKRRGIPWWLLLLTGFALGIIFTLSVSMRGGTTTVYSLPQNPDILFLQATQLVQQATLSAQAPLLMNEAMQNHQIASQFDPFAATATAIILQATQAANP